MNFLFSDDTIVACSTSTGSNSAIGVIRISGFSSLNQFKNLFLKDLSGPIEPRKTYFTKLVLQGQIIDEVCLTYFHSPNSYNGENILEISAHGNILNLERILDLFIRLGDCRLASPGEFTYRALKNKKLTLSQVEGLDLLLNATSGYSLDQGLSLLNGSLHDLYVDIYDHFLIHKSSLELFIDFSEDIGEDSAKSYFKSSLNNLGAKLNSLVKRVQPLSYNLVEPEVVILGLPNSGKSSLFNLLLSQNRSIVSPHPGTTRDYVSELINIKGVNYKLIDTAGIRKSSDQIEREGIKRAKEKINNGFFKILLINPFDFSPELGELLSLSPDLVLYTHSDLSGFSDACKLLEITYPLLGSIGAINLLGFFSEVENVIFSSINKKYLSSIKDQPILLDRHKILILKAYDSFAHYLNVAEGESDVAVLSSELNNLGHCFSELIGIVSPDDILNSIFSSFCIGK